MKPHLECAEQQVSRSNLTKYCACHAKRLAYLVLIAFETSFTVRGATGVTIQPTKYCACHAESLTYLVRIAYETSFTVRGATNVASQPHQILRLPRKITRLLYRPHIWNVISNARSNRCHYPTSPNTAPATKNDAARFQSKSPKQVKRHFQCGADPTMIRAWSENDPTMIRAWKRKPQPASQPRLLFELTTSIFYWKIQRFAPNLTFQPSPHTAPATKSDTWTSPSTAPATKSDTRTSPSTAPATKSDTRTSPSTAPATKSDTRTSPSTAPATKNDTARCQRKSPETGETSFPMRSRSEHDPRMIRPWSEHENANRNPPRNRGYFSSSPRAFSIEKYNVSRPILHSNLHHILRLPRKVTLERHQVLRLPRKVTLELHQVLRLPQKVTLELHQVLHLPRKVTLELHQVLRLPRKMTLRDVKENLPKQVKRHFQCGADPTMIRAWSQNDPTMIRAWKRKPQPASQPRLLFELTTSIFYWKIQRFAPNLTFKPSPHTAPATKSDTWTSPSTAPATKSDTWTSPSTAPATKSDTRTSPSTAPATKSDTRTSPSTAPATKSDTRTSPSTALLYLTLLYLTLLYLTLLYVTLLYLTLLYLTLLYVTLLYVTLLDLTLLYLTLLYLTLLYLTLLYLTLLYLTLLDFNFTGMSFVYRKFLS